MSVIKLEDIAYVRFAAPDLALMQGFLEDFGLTWFEEAGRLYGKGSDGRPFIHLTQPGEAKFLGVGLRADSIADLKTLAAHEGLAPEPLPEPLTEPGGGMMLRLNDPDGYTVEVVAGQQCEPPAPVPEPRSNSAAAKPRQRKPIRLDHAPANVRRIGHAVLKVSDLRASERWWKERFGFIASDEIEAAKDVPLGAFLACDRGDLPADHHTIFLAQLPGAVGLMHAAFEVADLDDLMLGHEFLKARQRKAAWGVGRHIMGSQIFDYWKDPFGNELEHWTDGGLFTAADPPQKQTMQALLAVQWGSPHPIFAGRIGPPPGLVTFVIALQLHIKRLFARSPKEA